jgi:hypothetical protein
MASSPAEALVVHRIFDDEESVLVDKVLDAITRKAPSDAATLRGLMDGLASLSEVLGHSRTLRKTIKLGSDTRTEKTLTDHLCQLDGLAGDLDLPMKATLSRTYLLAKINFFRACIIATGALSSEGNEFPRLAHELREELAQSIYTQLAEELLLALLRKPDVTLHTKRRAAGQLIAVWDNAQLEIDDFCPLLESAWRARNRVKSGFGALLGTTEYFRLVCEDCAPQFLDFFARDDLSRAEGQAFEEFLFNMTHEELCTLRETMKKQSLDTVTAEWASRVLSRPIEELDHSGEIDPMALYRSYYRRQLAADYRNIAGTGGPRRTAEAYLMIYLLDQ